MSSENGTQGVSGDRLRPDAGTQLLVATGSMQDPLSVLPATAFQNLLIVTADSPASIEEALVEQGADLSGVGVIPVSGSPVEYDGPLWTSDPVVPDDLTGLSMRYTSALDALEPGHGWVLFDSLNALLMYAQQDRVSRFFDHVTQVTAERDLRGVYTVATDAIDDETFAALQRSVDQKVTHQ